MMFLEDLMGRRRRGKRYQDSSNPRKFAVDACLVPLHYESVPGSGIFDTEINLAPQRTDNAVFDGWLVNENGWHYALGKDLAGHGDEDGWVGFGGRSGAHWLKFRLARFGYLHWPTRDWASIGGAPNYARSNLSLQTEPISLPADGQEMNVSARAIWSNLWEVAGGDVSIEWLMNGNGLKEQIIIDEVVREWVAANAPPATPATETYFGALIELDWSGVPAVWLDGLLMDRDGDFSTDEIPVVLTDEISQFIAFLPVGKMQVLDENGEILGELDQRYRFYKHTDGKHYLAVGVRVDRVNNLPAGALVIDPTIDTQVGATGDDGNCLAGVVFNATANNNTIGKAGPNPYENFFRFDNLEMSGTIDTAYFEIYGLADSDAIDTIIKAEDSSDPSAPTSASDMTGRTRTSANVAWLPSAWGSNAWYTSPSIVSVIQELVDSYSYSGSEALIIFWGDNGGSNSQNRNFRDYTYSSSLAPKLHIEYTVGGGYSMACESGSFSLTGQAAGLIAHRHLPAAPGSFVLAGQVAGLRAHRLLSAESGNYVLTGQAAGLIAHRVMAALPGSFVLAGQVAGLRAHRLLNAEAGAYVLTGFDADLGLVVVVVTPDERIYIIGFESRTLEIAGESRALAIPAESRVYAIEPESRVLVVPAEGRTMVIGV